MPSFQLPKTTALDANDALPGAKAKFFLSGTSTPEPVFADEDLTIPLGVEVIADGDGRFPPIYLDQTKTYKLTLTDADDVLLYTTDPVEPLALAGDDAVSKIRQIATTPLDFGAVGDGVADETAFVQQAIDEATYAVDLVGGTYRCDSTLVIPSGRKFGNGTIDASNLASGNSIEISGALSGVSTSTTAQANVGDVAVSVVSTASFSPGDYVIVACPPVLWAPGISISEMMRISSINSSTIMTFDTALSATYSSGTTTVTLVQMTENVVIENVVVSGDGVSPSSGLGLFATDRIRIRNCEIENFGGTGLSIVTSHDVAAQIDISDCAGSGVFVGGSSVKILVNDFEVADCGASGFVVGSPAGAGINKLVAMETGTINGCAEGITFNGGTHLCSASLCVVAGGATPMPVGIRNNGASTVIASCAVAGSTTSGIYHELSKSVNFTSTGGLVDTPSFTVTGNTIAFCSGSAIRFTDNVNSVDMSGVNINDNRIRAISGDGVLVNHSSSIVTNLNCLTNSIDQCTGVPIKFDTGANGEIRAYSVFNNNATRFSGTDGIVVAGFAGKIIDGNISTNIVDTTSPVLNSIHLVNVNRTSVHSNTMSGGGNGLHVEFSANPATGDINVTSNIFKSITGDEIRISIGAVVRGINITNNTCFSNPSNSIHLVLSSGTLLRSSVTGNTVNASLVNNLFIEGLGGSLADFTVSKNIFAIAATGRNIFGQFVAGTPVSGIIVSDNNIVTGALGNIVFNHADGGDGPLKISKNICNSATGGSSVAVINFSLVNMSGNTSISSTQPAFRFIGNAGSPSHISILGNEIISNASSLVSVEADNSQFVAYVNIADNQGNALVGIPAIVVSAINSSKISRLRSHDNNITGPIFDWDTPPDPATATAGPGIRLNAEAGSSIHSASVSNNNIEFVTSGIHITGAGTIGRFLANGNHIIRCTRGIDKTVTTIVKSFAGANYFDEIVIGNALNGIAVGSWDGSFTTSSADIPSFQSSFP